MGIFYENWMETKHVLSHPQASGQVRLAAAGSAGPPRCGSGRREKHRRSHCQAAPRSCSAAVSPLRQLYGDATDGGGGRRLDRAEHLLSV